jgi:hypothetical protein
MWRTQKGNRVLTGAEATLFKYALKDAMVWLDECGEDDDPWEIGVEVFDRLGTPEKYAMLELVASALLVPEVPCPELTAVSEGTVAAVYRHFGNMIEDEIDLGRRAKARRKALKAAREQGADELPKASSTDVDEWWDIVNGLMDGVLWDRDFEGDFIEPDDPPNVARRMSRRMGIPRDYYTGVAPDPNPEQLRKIRARLEELW